VSSIPGLAEWVRDPALLWLQYRPSAVAPIRPLAWELAYTIDAALKKKKKSLPPVTIYAGKESERE